jgi:micrococcal nuclease
VPKDPPTAEATRRAGRIVQVIDGDTLRVRLSSGRTERVRLIGIDTPEPRRAGTPECGAERASEYMRQIALDSGRGREVTLVSDPTQDRTDRFGRTLAYVDAPGIGDLGRLMVQAGWAKVYVYEAPFARHDRYQTALEEAKRRGAGVWGQCRGNFHRAEGAQ